MHHMYKIGRISSLLSTLLRLNNNAYYVCMRACIDSDVSRRALLRNVPDYYFFFCAFFLFVCGICECGACCCSVVIVIVI